MLAQAAEAAGRTAEDIVRVALVGNSCIHHLFLGLPIDTLVKAPYDPVVKGALKLPAAKFDGADPSAGGDTLAAQYGAL